VVIGGDLPVRFAPNGGGAVPGDRIVGILTPGEAVTIYPIQSPSLAGIRQPSRSAGSTCAGMSTSKRTAAVPGTHRGQVGQRAGFAGADCTTTIAEHDGNIDAVSDGTPDTGFHHVDHRPRRSGI
jgi:guanosine-3',5'-bis(diphosphate) 3'-pyrophosphohydrolase